MRTNRTADDLERLVQDLKDAGKRLGQVASEMRANDTPTIAIHSVTQFTRDVPSLLAWSYRIGAEWEVLSMNRQDDRSTASGNAN